MKTKKESKEFISQMIGQPDSFKKTRIISAYNKMLDAVCSYQLALEYCLKEVEGIVNIDFLLESFKEDTGKFIKRKFIEINKVKIPGISTEKLIESDLLDVENVNHAIQERELFNTSWEKIKETGFIYPLRRLNTDGENFWQLTDDFYQEVDKACSRFTENEDQNLILGMVTKLCDALNDMDALDIIRSANGPLELNHLSDFVEIDQKAESGPFIPSDVIFYKHRLRRFREKPILAKQKKTFEDFIA